MRRKLLLAVALLASSSAARAGDITPDSGYDWSGVYAGLNAGGAWTDSWMLSDDDAEFTGGGLIGYNWQHDRFVFSLETDLNYVGFGNDLGYKSYSPEYDLMISDSMSVDAAWFGTVRGRLGIGVENLLVYGTGGLAYGQVNVERSIDVDHMDGSVDSFDSSTDDLNYGWTLGAGFEYGFDKWSVGLEYLYVDLGDADYEVNYRINYNDTDSSEGIVSGWVDYNFSVLRATAKLRF